MSGLTLTLHPLIMPQSEPAASSSLVPQGSGSSWKLNAVVDTVQVPSLAGGPTSVWKGVHAEPRTAGASPSVGATKTYLEAAEPLGAAAAPC